MFIEVRLPFFLSLLMMELMVGRDVGSLVRSRKVSVDVDLEIRLLIFSPFSLESSPNGESHNLLLSPVLTDISTRQGHLISSL